MKTTTRRAVILVAAGAVGLGGLAVAAPALAGGGPLAHPSVAGTPGPGWPGGTGGGGMMGNGNGNGNGSGAGMMGGGAGTAARDGTGAALGITAPKGTLTQTQQATLASMAQEEKLAHDLYAAFAGRYDAVVFDHVAAAETQHLTAVRTLLQRYGLTDPTANRPAGSFSDPAVQASYDKLLAQGQAGQAAAIGVGQQVERGDVADLQKALDGLTAPDVQQVYNHLLAASQKHLAAFTRWSTR